MKINMSKNLRKQGEQKQKHKFDPPGKQWPQEPNGLEPLGVISSPLARWGKRVREKERDATARKKGRLRSLIKFPVVAADTCVCW